MCALWSAWLVLSPLRAALSDRMRFGGLAVARYEWWALPLTTGQSWGDLEHHGLSAGAWHGPSVPNQPFFQKCKSTCNVSLCAVEVIPLFIKDCQARHWCEPRSGVVCPREESRCPWSG